MISDVRASRATVVVTLAALLWASLDPLTLAGQASKPQSATSTSAKPPATQRPAATATAATPVSRLACGC